MLKLLRLFYRDESGATRGWGPRVGVLLVTGAVAGGLVVSGVIGGGSVPPPPGTANLWIDGAGSCTRSVTPVAYSDAAACSNMTTAYAAASAGDTVLMKAGSYTSTFAGGTKAPGVNFKAADGEHVVIGSIILSPQGTGGNFSVDSVNLNAFDSDSGNGNGSPNFKNITIKNSTFSGSAYFRNCGGGQTNILLDHNLHANIGSGSLEGRIHFPSETAGTCDVTIQNSILTGGSILGQSDGIQTGASGVQILGNKFENLIDCAETQGAGCGPHTDAIQPFDRTIIKNNFFINNTNNISQFDGGRNNDIENNIVTGYHTFGFVLGGDNPGSIMKHNTVIGNGQRTASINYTSKAGQTSVNESVSDNISYNVQLSNGTGGNATTILNDWNLGIDSAVGAHSIHATPIFVGGASPTTPAGFVLAPGSPGKNAADDGLDMGATTFLSPWAGAGNPF